MIITLYFNYLNHHQVSVADEMYRLIGDNFRFIATSPRNLDEMKGGIDYSDRPYCILASESDEANIRAHEFNKVSDVCVFGAGLLDWMSERAETGKLSFEVGERWLKKGWMNIFSPRLLKWWWLYQTTLKDKPFYKLCASAFAAQDDEKLGCYKGRHYKWGYFTQVGDLSGSHGSTAYASSYSSNSLNSEALNNLNQLNPNTALEPNEALEPLEPANPVRLMWCARMIDWKHPELAIECAKRLKADGYKFQLDMYGDGTLRSGLVANVERLELTDVVKLHGNVPNEQIQQAMRESDIFLFTSDCQEGWGAVANEAMAAGCCLVASDRLGAAPYLIRDSINGYMFRDRDADSLYKIVKYVIDNPEERIRLSKQAHEDIVNIWSPRNAAESLIHLIKDLQNQKDTTISRGPCSKA